MKMKIGSEWKVEHYRAGELIEETTDTNRVTEEGLDALLDIMFADDTQSSDWYIALFDDDHTPHNDDTYADPGYSEWEDYAEVTRPVFTPASASGGVMSNTASKATFTAATPSNVYGGALVNINTKGDTAAAGGVLFGAAKFGAVKVLASDDELKITVSLTVASV